MFEILKAGGWAMLPILVCSALALAIVLERFWSLRLAAVAPPGLGDEVREWARTRALDPQHIEALRRNSPLGELLAAALGVRHRPREIIKERVEDSGRHVVHRLDRFLNTLGTIALVSPLLGLLGTVFGLIRMFFAVMVSGVGDPLKMAGGIGEALVCTAAGLCVAIPAYVFHRYFRGRVNDLVVAMEREVFALTDQLTASAENSPANAAAAPRALRTRSREHAMRIASARREDDFEINVISLIDVLLTLLMFFVLTTTFVRSAQMQVTLPQAESAEQTVDANTLTVLIGRDGKYFIDNNEVLNPGLETLKQAIASVAGGDRKRPVMLRADALTPHQAVVTAMDALGELGFTRLSIATTQPHTAPPQ